MTEASFSFRELREAGAARSAGGAGLPALESIEASDGVALAFRRYEPASPRAALIFYHGGGAHSGAGYQYLGNGLKNESDVLVLTPDMRGHGGSGGPRGDAPSPEQVWADVTSFVQHVRPQYPGLPLFLGGHSSGAALALNCAIQPEHESLSGYIFLSPQLGARSGTDRPSEAPPFAKVDGAAFAAFAASGGATHGHDYAVQFNYPSELLAADPGLVAAITVTTSVALTPAAPREQFADLDRPFGLWIGSEDELLLPDKVLAFGDLAASVRADSDMGVIPGANHLSVLLTAHETIGAWILHMAASERAA